MGNIRFLSAPGTLCRARGRVCVLNSVANSGDRNLPANWVPNRTPVVVTPTVYVHAYSVFRFFNNTHAHTCCSTAHTHTPAPVRSIEIGTVFFFPSHTNSLYLLRNDDFHSITRRQRRIIDIIRTPSEQRSWLFLSTPLHATSCVNFFLLKFIHAILQDRCYVNVCDLPNREASE